MNCTTCGSRTAPVWAHYTGHALVHDLEGHAHVRLPMHQCPHGHIDAWREEEDCFVDLGLAKESTDFGSLTAGTVTVQRRLFGGARCGRCGERLHLEPTGERLHGTVRLPIDGQHDPAEFDVDLPEVACRTCSARPTPDSKAIRATAADVTGWLFQFIASAMPPDRVNRLEPRSSTGF